MATTSQPVVLRRRLTVRGVVQGVGFRPFVYNLALKHGVRGFILNSSSGVTIEAEGDAWAVQSFEEAVIHEPPVLARIEQVATLDLDPRGDDRFEIKASVAVEGEFALVSADVATCDACMREVLDPEDRRFCYPFTNCTNCGPRYTIIERVPYDRRTTTMAPFEMCAACAAEYQDPTNRRFHAQPNACADCGPSLAFVRAGAFLPAKNQFGFGRISSSVVLREVRDALRNGAIVAVKGLGGFQLACDAENDAAVRRLRARKKRSDKPFALMARDVAAAEKFCEVTDADRKLLLNPQHPIVILASRADTGISANVSPGNPTVGVMLAYTPLHALLFGESAEAAPEFIALVMTSGNISEEPIVTRNEEAWQKLSVVADWFLFHNRDIHMRVDDSVARTFAGRDLILRRSRGYAPQTVDLGHELTEVLACGGELKNAFCLTKGRYAILSQHIGDVENYETLRFFEETLANLKGLFHVEPRAVAHDLHPLYLTTRLAGRTGLPMIGVQHHHAHIAACMAENHLPGKVIGVALDGTGYGTDGQIWGGEFLTVDYARFTRAAHLRYVPLPGGDVAVRQTWRAGLSWLRESLGDGVPNDLPLFRDVPQRELELVSRMLAKRLNSIHTSSCGRLFDAVASIIGLRHEATFEGQAAIELESIAQAGVEDEYAFELIAGNPAQIDLRPAIRAIAQDVIGGVANPVISARFHNTVAAVITEMCCRMREAEGLERVCLSGGTFQNIYLLKRTITKLCSRGFEIFTHSQVPPNDGGISLGQAVIANAILERGV